MRGKYSPYQAKVKKTDFSFNAYGAMPVAWTEAAEKAGVVYNPVTMLPAFDDEGFDCYGYSCFSAEGVYLGLGDGVDRGGYTESQYWEMTAEEFEDLTN